MIQHVPGLYYSASNIHGLGVFCLHDLTVGDVIEICPVIILDQDTVIQRSDALYQYYFIWEDGIKAIALGYGSLYNYSTKPNAEFTPDFNDNTLIITAVSDIPAGNEITIDYHAGNRESELWFNVLGDKGG